MSKVDIVEDEDDEDSATGEHYFFLLPGDFGDSASSEIKNVDEGYVHANEVASLSYSESEEEYSFDSDTNDSVLIGEVFEELTNEPEGTEEEEEPTQVLLNEGDDDDDDDGGSMITANPEGGACWNEATPSTLTAAPLLGSIWVIHPKYGCMVRRSSRLSRLG